MFFLPLLDGNSQGLEHVVQLPEKRCQMRAADDNLNLGLFPKRLLRFQYLVTMRLKSFRLQIDADKREVIRSVVDRKPDFAQCATKPGSGTSGISLSFFPRTVMS